MEVWKVINKERRRKMEVNREIEIKDWDRRFKKLLEGSESRKERGKKRK